MKLNKTNQINTLQADIVKLQQNIRDKESKINAIQQRFITEEEDHSSTSADLIQTQLELKDKKSQLSAKKTELAAWRTKHRNLDTDYNILEEQYDILEEEHYTMKLNKTNQISSLNSSINTLYTDLKNIINKNYEESTKGIDTYETQNSEKHKYLLRLSSFLGKRYYKVDSTITDISSPKDLDSESNTKELVILETSDDLETLLNSAKILPVYSIKQQTLNEIDVGEGEYIIDNKKLKKVIIDNNTKINLPEKIRYIRNKYDTLITETKKTYRDTINKYNTLDPQGLGNGEFVKLKKLHDKFKTKNNNILAKYEENLKKIKAILDNMKTKYNEITLAEKSLSLLKEDRIKYNRNLINSPAASKPNYLEIFLVEDKETYLKTLKTKFPNDIIIKNATLTTLEPASGDDHITESQLFLHNQVRTSYNLESYNIPVSLGVVPEKNMKSNLLTMFNLLMKPTLGRDTNYLRYYFHYLLFVDKFEYIYGLFNYIIEERKLDTFDSDSYIIPGTERKILYNSKTYGMYRQEEMEEDLALALDELDTKYEDFFTDLFREGRKGDFITIINMHLSFIKYDPDFDFVDFYNNIYSRYDAKKASLVWKVNGVATKTEELEVQRMWEPIKDYFKKCNYMDNDSFILHRIEKKIYFDKINALPSHNFEIQDVYEKILIGNKAGMGDVYCPPFIPISLGELTNLISIYTIEIEKSGNGSLSNASKETLAAWINRNNILLAYKKLFLNNKNVIDKLYDWIDERNTDDKILALKWFDDNFYDVNLLEKVYYTIKKGLQEGTTIYTTELMEIILPSSSS